MVSLDDMGALFLKKCSHYEPWLIAKQNKQKTKDGPENEHQGHTGGGDRASRVETGAETGQIHKRPPPRDGPSSLGGLLFLSRPWSEYGTGFPLSKAPGQSSGTSGLSRGGSAVRPSLAIACREDRRLGTGGIPPARGPSC